MTAAGRTARVPGAVKPGRKTATAPPPAPPLDPAWTRFLDDLAQRWQAQTAERKQDRSRRRQHEILQAALRVFSRDGIARARISDIAAEAGVPVSSIYEYYASKEDIAYAVPLTQLGQFFLEYCAQAPQVAGARARLRLYLWMTTDFARRNPQWARLLYLEVWPSVLVAEARVRTGLDEFVAIIVGLITEGEAAGAWAAGPNRYETATILVGSVNQIIITWLMYRRPRDISRGASSLIDRLLSCLLPPLPASPEAEATGLVAPGRHTLVAPHGGAASLTTAPERPAAPPPDAG